MHANKPGIESPREATKRPPSLSRFELRESLKAVPSSPWSVVVMRVGVCHSHGRVPGLASSSWPPRVGGTAFLSFTPIPAGSSWQRRAHSGRCINLELPEGAERTLGSGLCQNQPCSPDNRVSQLSPLGRGASCGTKPSGPEFVNVHTLAFRPVAHFGKIRSISIAYLETEI